MILFFDNKKITNFDSKKKKLEENRKYEKKINAFRVD